MKYTCYKCGSEFSQKCHLDNHLNRKKTCQKCPIGFNSQYCYINDKCIHINQYKQNINQYKKDKFFCYRGHELVFCSGEKNKPYFRHKNSDDVGGEPMSEWHLRMQSYFPVTEKWFKNNNSSQLKARRADVVIEEFNYVIEIQHSKIDDANVKCRHDDYKLHNMNVIWLIDGNTKDVSIEELNSGGFLIIFSEDWKYKSFQYNNENILLDINDKIFKIPLKNVCNKMFLAKEWKPIDLVMEQLKNNPDKIWDFWSDDNEIKATLTVHQKGAGNGKTYGIWKSILTNMDKESFIIITKQHSAKEVIKHELDEQAKRDEIHIENMLEASHESYNKQLKVKYINKKSNRECIVIIGTIDSFMYNIADTTNISGNDFFQKVLDTIHNEGCKKVNSNTGSLKYAGENVNLNKKTEIWIDEAQDLNEGYFNAMVKIMLETKVDVVIVGDKLQSLDNEINMITKTKEEIPNIHIIRETPINDNRRICVKNMTEKLNELIHFQDFSMNPISIDNKRQNTLLDHGKVVIEIIGQKEDVSKPIYNDKERKKKDEFIDSIIKMVDNEVKKHNYKPEDFLFVFPIMKNNIIAGELETRLNEYWIEKLSINEEEEEYNKYAVLHRHQEGKVIDMTISEKASRIVSIKSSKGDGRKVVFVLNCTEMALKLLTRNHEIDLLYESYFHVAMTRAKNKIYFGLTKNNDDIHKRFGDSALIEYEPNIKNLFTLDNLIQYIDKDSLVGILKENNIQELKEKEKTKEQNEMVDWNYHCIRRAIYIMYCIFNILRKNKNKISFKNSQINTVLDKISKLPIIQSSPREFYEYLKKEDEKYKGSRHCSNKEKEELDLFPYFPLCNLSDKKIYKSYALKIKKIMEKNQSEYKKDPFSIANFTPKEQVLQWYMIDIEKNLKYHQTTPTTIYNIIDYFEKEDDNKVTELLKETEFIKETIDKAMNELLNNEKNIKWNIEHSIYFGGKTKDIKLITRNMEIIGFSNTSVYHMVFQSDFNKLNYWDTLIEILLERFILYNTSDKGKDIDKFKNKTIKTYLFSLKDKSYEVFHWDWDNDSCDKIKEEIKNAIIKYYSSFNKQLFQYCAFLSKRENIHKWKNQNFTTPYDYISSKYVSISYVNDFFKMLHNKWKENKEETKKIANNETIFSEKIVEFIEESCDKFFGIQNEDDDDWE